MLYDQLFTRSQCCNCQQDISGLGIECAECHGGNFRLCIECFSLGAEIGQHKPDHRYRFFDSGGSLALFPASANEVSSTKENDGRSQIQRWSAREEIRLLDAIEQYGFGNWCDISGHIETKTSSEAKKEFVERFVQGCIGQLSWDDRNNNEDLEFRRNIGILPKPIDHTVPCDDGPLSPSLTQRLPPLDIGAEEMVQLGYMPYRDDYEKEYDNEAEKLVAQLAFTSEDDETDVALKLALVDMYSRRLKERARRKRVIRDYQLVCKFFKKDKNKAAANNGESNGGLEKKRFQSYEKNLQEKLRPFAQFLNSREFDHLICNLVKEKDYKVRLQELYKYRSNGITRAEDCSEYEKSKSTSGLRGKRNAASAMETLQEDEDNEDRSYKKVMIQSPAPPTLIQQLQQPSLMQGSPNQRGSPLLSGVRGGSNDYASPSPTPLLFSRDDFNLKSLESNVSELALLPQLLEEEGMDQAPLSVDPLEENSSPPSVRPRGTEGLYTANFIPGSEQLTEDELNLCMNINLLPAQFLTIKLAFILGRLKPNDQSESTDPTDENVMECPPDMEEREWDQILEFFSLKDDNNSTNSNSNSNNSSSSQYSMGLSTS